MKRALTAIAFGGVLMLFVPQAASAGTRSAFHVGGYHSTADDKAPDAGDKAAGDSAAPKQDPPGEGRSHYDRLHHDGDTF